MNNKKITTDMKRLTIILLCAVCSVMMVTAREKVDKIDYTKYLAGAVVEENGIVTFTKTFSIKGMEEAQIRSLVLGYIKTTLVGSGIEGNRTRLVDDGKDDGTMVARVEEWMVFKRGFAYLDATRFRYTVTAKVEGNRVTMKINQISYLYDERIDDENKPTGEEGTVYVAEEWIDDAHGLNKKKNRLAKGSGKFRYRTCERVEKIFDKMMDFFEDEAKEEEAKKLEKPVEVKKRKFITEE